MMLVTLFNVSFPENAMFTFRFITQITRFNLIPMDKFINLMFSFIDGYEQINFNFEMMGYDTPNILETLDSILAFIFGVLSFMMLTLLVRLFIGMCPR